MSTQLASAPAANSDSHGKAELLQPQAAGCDMVGVLAAPQVCAAIMMSSLCCISCCVLRSRTLYSCFQT